MFRPQLLAILGELIRFLACAAYASNCMVGIIIIIIIIIIVVLIPININNHKQLTVGFDLDVRETVHH